jgi:hypothetical protein
MKSPLIEFGPVVLAIILVILALRIGYCGARGTLTQPEDWSAVEKKSGRWSAWAFALASLVSVLIAGYVATRVPWVDNLPALLGRPQVVSGRPTWAQSTWPYLFTFPISPGLLAAVVTDPWTNRLISFRGPRDLILRAAPAFALAGAIFSIWHSLVALAAK